MANNKITFETYMYDAPRQEQPWISTTEDTVVLSDYGGGSDSMVQNITYLGQPTTNINLSEKETVNHPEHYNPGVYEAINVIEHYKLGFHLGNSVKYILRAGKKHDNVKEDIEKAIWYLQRYKDTL